MASLRNAMKSQKTHRERDQPESRKDLGLLEKKKDYILRARDYEKKKKTLKLLRQKALNKNPDEFYFHMINSQVMDGVHVDKAKEEALTPEQVKLLQTRDLAYVINKRTIEKRKIEKLKAQLHLLANSDEMPQNTHTFFVDSDGEKKRFDPARRLGTHPDLLDRTYNIPKMSDIASGKFESIKDGDRDEITRQRQKAYKILSQRIERERQLGVVQAKMEARRHLQSKKEKPAKMVQEETKDSAPVYKWLYERKR